ncbi:MAG: hypothetical protein OSJ70_09910 [Bacilli bacterium]|nr:hypothetical protein [Bacilli bacterium]
MDTDINYIIKKTNILLVEVKCFTHLAGINLIEEELGEEDIFRKILFYDHMFIDLETGDILEELWDKDGNIKRPVYANTRYITQTYLYPNVTDEDLLKAANLYEATIRKKKLLEEKKLIKFPQRRIY